MANKKEIELLLYSKSLQKKLKELTNELKEFRKYPIQKTKKDILYNLNTLIVLIKKNLKDGGFFFVKRNIAQFYTGLPHLKKMIVTGEQKDIFNRILGIYLSIQKEIEKFEKVLDKKKRKKEKAAKAA